MTNEEKRDIIIPPCHDKKMEGPVDADFIVEQLRGNLKAFQDVGNEYVTFVVRTQDENGEWFFSMATTSLEGLKSGAKIHLTKDKKVVVE